MEAIASTKRFGPTASSSLKDDADEAPEIGKDLSPDAQQTSHCCITAVARPIKPMVPNSDSTSTCFDCFADAWPRLTWSFSGSDKLGSTASPDATPLRAEQVEGWSNWGGF